MNKSFVDFDVELWSYVLYYKNKKYFLNTQRMAQANELAELKLLFLKRQEANEQESSKS